METRVLIHACPERMWYVDEYLVPSIREQGIDDIIIWNDTEGYGNLLMWLKCCERFGNEPGGMWHLQDDVLIAHDFGERIRQYDEGMVCGFCHDLYETEGVYQQGYVFPFLMWQSSFPCIRIPNEVLGHFLKWYNEKAVFDSHMQKYIKTGKCDDTLFRYFMTQERRMDRVLNLVPHLVEHVDWIIGGSTINSWRGYPVKGAYFFDDYLVDNLIDEIAKRRAR